MEDKTFELLEKMYSEFTGFKNEVKEEFSSIKGEVSSIKEEVKQNSKHIQKIQITLENDVKPKIEALFEGYNQHSKLLEDIRDEVARHEEVIIKRVK